MKQHPIVILHGWGLSSDRFAGLIGELKKQHFQVYAPDFPGFGTSHPPDRPWYLTNYVNFLHEYLKKQKITKPIFIGHSFGGRVALKYQAWYPNTIQALVLTGTPGFTPIPKKKLMLFVALAKMGKLVFSLPLLAFFQERVRRWYYYVVGARDYFRATGVMRQTFKNIVPEELVTSMEKIRVPTVLIWGEKDIITPLSIAARMKDIIPNTQLIVLPQGDHGVAYKNPRAFTAALLPWLATL